MKCKKLVIDTAAFIKNLPLWEYSEDLYTVKEVINEIRDKATKRSIDAYPVELKFRCPSASSVKFINDFTRKTGDYANLSLTDTKILALTYELEVETKQSSDHLRTEPKKCRTIVTASKPVSEPKHNIEGWYVPSNMDDASQASVCSPTEESLQEKLQSLEITEEEEIESDEGFEKSSEDPESVEEVEDENEIFNDDEYEIVEEEQEDDDDDEGWITPSSLKKMKENKIDFAEQNEDIDVACITADYAMQNTLRHIGLSVIGVDGKIITNVRTFILRCYACFKTTDKMELLFCKHCGNKTLKRVSVTMNPDGTQKIWISTRRPINTRGTKFTLPMPKGGKHAVNPILVADQREAQQLAAKRYRMKNDPMHEDYGIRTSPFITRDVYSRSFHVGVTGGNKHRGLYYWEQKNPNEPMKKNKSRRKKRQ